MDSEILFSNSFLISVISFLVFHNCNLCYSFLLLLAVPAWAIGKERKRKSSLVLAKKLVWTSVYSIMDKFKVFGQPNMWRRLSTNPFGLMPGSKCQPTYFLLVIKLVFINLSDNFFGSDISQKFQQKYTVYFLICYFISPFKC